MPVLTVCKPVSTETDATTQRILSSGKKNGQLKIFLDMGSPMYYIASVRDEG
jgi:hypothetical protein